MVFFIMTTKAHKSRRYVLTIRILDRQSERIAKNTKKQAKDLSPLNGGKSFACCVTQRAFFLSSAAQYFNIISFKGNILSTMKSG